MNKPMTPKQRAIEALELRIPDEVPTFELEFQLEDLMFGKSFYPPELSQENIRNMSKNERQGKIYETVEYMHHVYTSLEYCIIPAYSPFTTWDNYDEGIISEDHKFFLKHLSNAFEGQALLGAHGDGTFGIPDGNSMYDFAYRTADDPEGLKAEAQRNIDRVARTNYALKEAGIDVSLLCSDYCYNSGPFLSPDMFREFIQPYLAQNIATCREYGLYTIKHTDGDIMPIIDQMVECKPHALHSIDPMAGVDIREVKRLYGDQVALCGNVHCAALQTGTEQEVIDSAEYCLTYGKENGGYIFCTSNVPFKGMPVNRYQLILDIWKRMRAY